MKLPEQLPSDPEELERLYHAYAQDVEDFDDAEFQRIMDARLATWGIDPHQMTADQIFGAMSESMNSMLTNLYAAKDEAPDDEAVRQVGVHWATEQCRDLLDFTLLRMEALEERAMLSVNVFGQTFKTIDCRGRDGCERDED